MSLISINYTNSREVLLKQGHIENLSDDNKAWSSEQTKDIKLNRYEARQVCLRIAKMVMSKREYQVYYMHIVEKKLLREIAEELGLNYNNVKITKQRANNKIKQVVKESGLAKFVK